jgi:hypothetical protein
MQRDFCLLDARSAKELGSTYNWQENGAIFHWNGQHFSRFSKEYWEFLKRAYDAVVDQNSNFAAALFASGHCILWHSVGKLRENQTCLTTFEFICLLYRARRRARKRRLDPPVNGEEADSVGNGNCEVVPARGSAHAAGEYPSPFFALFQGRGENGAGQLVRKGHSLRRRTIHFRSVRLGVM